MDRQLILGQGQEINNMGLEKKKTERERQKVGGREGETRIDEDISKTHRYQKKEIPEAKAGML